MITWQTRAHGPGAGHLTVSIGSTGGGGAGVHRLGRVDGQWVQGTLHKGITEVSLVTLAHRLVIDHSALGIDAAGAGAGVLTLLTNTGQAGRAFMAEDTLGLALDRGVTLVGLDALTHGLATPLTALSIDATRAGVTDINRSGRVRNDGRLSASCERVSDGARGAAADGIVISHLAHSVDPTGAGTGVNTLLGNAGQTGPTVIILQTLCSAACSGHGVSLVSPDTGADHLANIVLTALGVGATGRGLTRVLDHTA